MIVDGPNTIDLAVGTDRRVIESSDAQLSLPPVLMPVLLNLKAHIAGPASATVQRQSAMYRSTLTRTNQAGLQQTFATLDKGLWELEITMASLFTAFIAGVGTFIGTALLLSYNGIDHPILRRIGFTGSYVDFNRMRILVLSQATLALEVGTTGAGQSSDADVQVNCIRVL